MQFLHQMFSCVHLAAGRRTEAAAAMTNSVINEKLNIHLTFHDKTTHLRCGGIFSDSIITNFLLIPTVK